MIKIKILYNDQKPKLYGEWNKKIREKYNESVITRNITSTTTSDISGDLYINYPLLCGNIKLPNNEIYPFTILLD